MDNGSTALARKLEIVGPTIIRAERFHSLAKSVKLNVVINDKIYAALNVSETGLALHSEMSDFTVGEHISIKIYIHDNSKLIHEGRAKIVWYQKADENFNYGISLTSHFISQKTLNALESSTLVYEKADEEVRKCKILPAEFRCLVMELKEYLSVLKLELDTLQKSIAVQGIQACEAYTKAIEFVIEPKVTHELKRYSVELHKILSKDIEKAVRDQAVEFFRRHVNEYFLESPFLERAHLKPRGYAGDYEMMNQIYRNNFEGFTFFSQLIHRYAINEFSSQSVRYRKEFFMGKFRKYGESQAQLKIATVACGPAREVLDFCDVVKQEDSGNYNFVLMDQDIEALLDAKRGISQKIMQRNLQTQVVFSPISVKDILEGAVAVRELKETRFNLIYSAGLYDYLTQSAAKLLTIELFSLLEPGGELIIGNFHPNNPTQTMAELTSNWRLIHRTEEEMRDLVNWPGVEAEVHFDYDIHRIELLMTVKKRA